MSLQGTVSSTLISSYFSIQGGVATLLFELKALQVTNSHDVRPLKGRMFVRSLLGCLESEQVGILIQAETHTPFSKERSSASMSVRAKNLERGITP